MFTKQSVEDKLRNVIYTGKYVYNKANGKKKKKRLLLRDYPELVRENDHPPIVSQEEFNKANEILDNRTSTRTNDRDYIYLLRGLIECKHCKKKMIGGSNKGGSHKNTYHYYKCPGHKYGCHTKDINAKYIDKSISSIVVHLINNLDLKEEISKAINEEIKLSESGIARKEKYLVRKKQELIQQTPLLTDPNLPDEVKDGYREIAKETVEDINQTKEIIKNIKGEIEGLKRIELDTSLDVESLLTMRHQGRDLIKHFIDKIVVDGDEITVQLKKGKK